MFYDHIIEDTIVSEMTRIRLNNNDTRTIARYDGMLYRIEEHFEIF